MAGAAGGFVTRAFQSMLKESSAKKFTTLHSAIQSYLDGIKEEKKQPVSDAIESEPGSGEAVDKQKGDHEIAHASVETKHAGQTVQANVSITTALSNAGHTLEEAEAELVLSPLRIAFETKNIKIVELALDCFHKLIAYDHLEGDPGLDGGKNGALFADILSMICSCVENSSSDTTVLQVLKALLTAIASTKFRVHGEPLLGVIRICYNIALYSKSPMNQATSKAMLTQMVSIIFQRMESDLNVSHGSKEFQDHCSTGFDALAGDTSKSSPKSNIEVSSLEDTILQNSVKDASLASIEELYKLASGTDIKGLEAILDKVVNLKNLEKIKLGLDLESLSIGHRDALLLFRTLCKMGAKADNDIMATKTNVLSLELLQGLLEDVSHAFTKNFHFINTIKAYLSYTLLQSSISSSPQIFQQAAGIFLVLLLRFRETLKGEIAILFPLIVLRCMDTAECPSNQRLSVLRILEKLCKDPQMLLDIFVNYDCDLHGLNLLERMVTTLSKTAQGTQASDPNSVAASQSASIKDSSLQCLVNVFKTLVDWEKSHKESDHNIKDGKSLDGCSGKDAIEIEQRKDTNSDFEETKSCKSTVEAVIAQSNLQPSKGMEYLISNKLVENSSASVADFLKNTPNLDKGMVGDILGQDEEFSLSVMHAYVDSMNFSGMTFATAMREFLSGFRLPGEAQKIDRIMEKFAERYCADNPALFKNADTVYNLTYAVIMLNTDVHNPKVTAKMSKADFVHLNSKADAEEIPPQEFLEEIYDSIVKEKLKMKDDDIEGKGCLISILNLGLPRRKPSTETMSERDAIVKQTQAIFQNRGTNRGVFYMVKRVELLTMMTEAVGWPLLATFSVIMEEGDNMSRVQLCMEGFKAGIHITNVLGMDTMRYAFLTSLVRFTFLHAPKEMRSKNVEALRTLLDLGESNADALENTWNSVLECITRLDFITSNSVVAITVMQASNQISKDALLQSLRQLAGKPTEQLFLNSVRLPSDAVIEFFTALCSVSAEELKQNPARVYSLQKLVEISYYNMARIRMVWARIWSVLADHFVFAGSHHDEKVAMDAIASLRQLGMKYLERAELSSFTFQNDILKPFVVLMRNSQNESMRRLIVDCIVQMIKLKVGSIKSGWRSVFMIFTAAADDESEPIVESAFENVEQVILEHFDKVVGDCFMDCVNCLIGFANNKSSHRISLKAIALLRICEDRLAEGLVPGGSLKPIDPSPDEVFDVTEQYWFPMLAGLSDLTSDPRVEVRNCALEVLFDLLNERGTKFSPSFWESIFRRVLFPIFDNVRHAGNETSLISSDDEWLHETCIHSLQLLCNLFNTFYKEVFFMLPPLLSLLLDCAKKTDQSVVSIALGALVHLVEAGGHQFSDNDWDTLLKSIRDASFTTQPLELLRELGFQHSNTPTSLGDSKPDVGGGGHLDSRSHESVNSRQFDGSEDLTIHQVDQGDSADLCQNSEMSEGLPTPSQKTSEDGELQRNQSLGQRIMGNVFLRSFTSKAKYELDVPVQSQTQALEAIEFDSKAEVETPLLTVVRGKCVTQLLLLGAIDCIQKKYWLKLNAQQKVSMMEILLSILDFASSYNSYHNLRLRMQQLPADRPPSNLLRQELAGTCVYLDVLQRTTSELGIIKENNVDLNDSPDTFRTPTNNYLSAVAYSNKEEQLQLVAEEKLVSFCGNVLKEASEFQMTAGGTNNKEIHRVLELRSPVIVKVIKGMAAMNSQIFRKHLRVFYPLLAKLVCCDQMDVRRALGELFKSQFSFLLP